jgi:hypothetical protein
MLTSSNSTKLVAMIQNKPWSDPPSTLTQYHPPGQLPGDSDDHRPNDKSPKKI